ncbi:hypothetical protein [Ramlibacter rhizophilus]|uniref:DUF4148 domain-containing protein n=1 Tax=Ramlibacter rhizophilus TaxID=1781167 RepID=A0A4Z0C2U6_9BURK|nr:hypothetical protein [Ramlibacter rhizophilus]TFZ04818.1 hypothetical protein EZ242_03445 [Ramlibacter rhizophilus]
MTFQSITHSVAYATTVVAATLAATLVASSARAEGPIAYPSAPIVSERSRAEVQAEVRDNRQAISAQATEWALQQHTAQPFMSMLSRAQVRGDYIAAREQVDAMTSEDSGSAYLASHATRFPSGVALASSAFR